MKFPDSAQRQLSIGRFFMAAGLALCLAGPGCKKKEEHQAGAAPQEAPAGGTAIAPDPVLGGDLFARIPSNAFAVFRWEGSHPAHKKLLTSPWADSGEFSSMLKSKSPELERMEEFFAKLGLDAKQPDTWGKVLADAIGFAAPGTGPQDLLSMGIVFRHDKSFSFKDKLSVIRDELKKQNAKIDPVVIPGGDGFVVVLNAGSAPAGAGSAPPAAGTPNQNAKFVLAATSDLGVIASDETTAKQLLAGPASSRAVIVDSDGFKRAFQNTPGSDARFGVAYFDAKKAMEYSKQAMAQIPDAQIGEMFPALQGVGISYSMQDAPRTDIRILLDPARSEQSFLKQLGTSESGKVLGGVPKNALLFFSIDGGTLKRFKDFAAASIPPDQQQLLLGDLAVLDGVKRIGLAARIAAPGKSALPIPDLMVAIECDAPEKTSAKLREVVSKRLAETGLVGETAWNSKQVGAVAVHSMAAGFGVNFSVATSGNLVWLSSSDDLLSSLLAQSNAMPLAQSFSPQTNQTLVGKNSLMNVYINFNEIGTLIETMGGLLQLYAPQDPNAKQVLDPANIASLKKMGAMVASVDVGNDMIGIQSFYQPVS